MQKLNIKFPHSIDNPITEDKGWISGVVVELDDTQYILQFYDQIRIVQEMADELSRQPLFYEKNLIIVDKVSKTSIEKAIKQLFDQSRFSEFAAEQEAK